jgi:hypothetical protein
MFRDFRTEWRWLKYGEHSCHVREECELGRRYVIWPMTEVISHAVSRHRKRISYGTR